MKTGLTIKCLYVLTIAFGLVFPLTMAINAQPQQPFVTVWNTANPGVTAANQIRIPTTGGGYLYDVYWENVGNPAINANLTGFTGDAVITFPSPGTYRVEIRGQFPRIFFNFSGDRQKIINIEQWGDIEWSSFERAFARCTNLTISAVDAPDLSIVTNMSGMFREAYPLISDLNNWDVSGVQRMDQMFYASSFNANISAWDVSNVQNMGGMFSYNSSFNGDLSAWDVGNARNMQAMFLNASSFNSDISAWDVGNVMAMQSMFQNASSFNADISGWDVGNVIYMYAMFQNATSFDHSLGSWNVENVTNMNNMLNNSGLSTLNYDATLTGWSQQNLRNNITLGADGLTYCSAENARQHIINTFNWYILGDGKDCTQAQQPFVTVWNTANPGVTANNQIRIPTTGGGYLYDVFWENVGNPAINATLTGFTDDAVITFPSPGTYRVEIRGQFPRINFNNSGDHEKIISIEQWGDIEWTSFQNAFMGCTNLTSSAVDAPDLSNVTDLSRMFYGATSFNSDLNNWDVSGITNMWSMFSFAESFNGNIGDWDVSNVGNFESMFDNATSFNQDLTNWDVSTAINVKYMFSEATSFNGDVSTWSFSSSLSSIEGMFYSAVSFNGDLSNWVTRWINNMSWLFYDAHSFNQSLDTWEVQSVNNMESMLSGAGLSTENYDATLTFWERQVPQHGVQLDAHGLTYCAAASDRQNLIDTFGWTITGDALDCPAPPPTPLVTYPTGDFETTDPNITFTGTAEPNSEITVYIDNQAIPFSGGVSRFNKDGSLFSTVVCTTIAGGGGTWSCSFALEPGINTYFVTATSPGGTSPPAGPFVITLSNITNVFPAAGYATFAFEDLWPAKGDYDFNDVVVDYRFIITTSHQNYLIDAYGIFVLRAFGAYYQNGFGFQLPQTINQNDVTVTGYSLTENYITLNPNGLEAGQSQPTIIVFDNGFNQMAHPGGGIGINTELNAPYVTPDTLVIHMVFTPDTYTSADLNVAAIKPFIMVNLDRGREVHLPGRAPTDLANHTYFGTEDDRTDPAAGIFYVTKNNLPWGLSIIEQFDYPTEKTDITMAFHRFRAWAESGGVLFPDWYQDKPGYRNNALIYIRN